MPLWKLLAAVVAAAETLQLLAQLVRAEVRADTLRHFVLLPIWEEPAPR
jgi:hypothetical protein